LEFWQNNNITNGGFKMENSTVTKTNETFLPLFSGFYGTNWEFRFDNIEENIRESRHEKGLYSDFNMDDLKIDFESYELDIVKNFAEALQDILCQHNFVYKIEVQKIVHPKAYNFKNDAVHVSIEYNAEALKDFIYSRHESFCQYLKARYTSRDGFISWFSNEFETWENETNHFSDFSKNGHFLGAILEFVCAESKITEFDFYESVFENIYFDNYAENMDEIINKMDGTLYEFLTSKGIAEGFADYIENSYNNGLLASLSLSEKVLSVIREFEAFKAEA
jgi:hypothetical protein